MSTPRIAGPRVSGPPDVAPHVVDREPESRRPVGEPGQHDDSRPPANQPPREGPAEEAGPARDEDPAHQNLARLAPGRARAEHLRMTFDIVFVLGLALVALVLFAIDRLRLDQVAMAIPVALLLGGILTPAEAVSGLSSRATVTVGAMLVLGLGLRKTGLVAAIGLWARTAPLGGPYSRMFVLCLIVAFFPLSSTTRPW